MSQSVIKKPTHIGMIGLLSKYSLVMHHHEPECLGKRFCYQGQGHSEGKTWLFELLLECLVERFDYCVEGQGHKDGSKLDYIFVSLVFSVPLVSLQPT